ncbi:MAG: RNA methyltransferase [Bacteroidota bacterium]
MQELTDGQISPGRAQENQLSPVKRHPIIVVLENVRSLYNVGSIFRTSDGACIEKLYLCGFTSHPPRSQIEKTALGATRTVPWEYRKHPVQLIAEIKSRNFTICVLERTTESVPYYSISPTQFPLCLVVGNELVGVTKKVIERADTAVEIPMFGTKQSLNVAVAYGIAVFEFVRILHHEEKQPSLDQP